jgi:hypothetical protein
VELRDLAVLDRLPDLERLIVGAARLAMVGSWHAETSGGGMDCFYVPSSSRREISPCELRRRPRPKPVSAPGIGFAEFISIAAEGSA